MRVPLISGAVEDGDAKDHDLAQVTRQGGPAPDRTEQAIPAVSDGRTVQEHPVHRAKLPCPPGADPGRYRVISDGIWKSGHRLLLSPLPSTPELRTVDSNLYRDDSSL